MNCASTDCEDACRRSLGRAFLWRYFQAEKLMLIKTSEAQDSEIAEWYRSIVRAHTDEDCMPPGFTLQVRMGEPSFLGYDAIAVCGTATLELGEVDVSFPA